MSKVCTELHALRVSREVMRIKGDGGLIVGRKYGDFDGCFEGVEIGRMSKIGEENSNFYLTNTSLISIIIDVN